MGRLASCPWGGEHGHGDGWGVQAGVMHMTYGALDSDTFSGDVATVANGGLAHFVIGKNYGEWTQLADTTQVTYNVGNWDLNHHSVAIEFSGVNENVLTDWQCVAGGAVVAFVRDTHGVAVKYDDGSDGANDTAPWSGWYAHRAVVPDNPPQHFDFIDLSEWARIAAFAGDGSQGDGDLTPEEHTALVNTLATAQNAANIASGVRNSLDDPKVGVNKQLADLRLDLAAIKTKLGIQ